MINQLVFNHIKEKDIGIKPKWGFYDVFRIRNKRKKNRIHLSNAATMRHL